MWVERSIVRGLLNVISPINAAPILAFPSILNHRLSNGPYRPHVSRRLIGGSAAWIRCLLLLALTARLPAAPAVFTSSDLPGLEASATVMRRDPSDIIKVGDHYYVWYTKGAVFHGYDSTIWFATSPDGRTWTERGEALARGGVGTWDEQSVFTPGILVAQDKYWLFFTAVPKPFTNEGNRVTKSAIGIAVADSPDGPWKKLPENPVLRTSDDPAHFDSMRVDDACLLVRGGRCWLYYKGRQWDNTPANTKLGVAIAERPGGPYVKSARNPIIPAGHEVLVWPRGPGVVTLINIGPAEFRQTLHYAADGLTFTKLASLPAVPGAAAAYRPEAFTDRGRGEMITWGLSITTKPGMLPSLQRFDCDWSAVPELKLSSSPP